MKRNIDDEWNTAVMSCTQERIGSSRQGVKLPLTRNNNK